MGFYSGSGTAAVGTNKTLLSLFQPAAALKRARITEVTVSSDATPADVATRFSVLRNTAQGTEGSGFTPTLLDPADGAASLDFGVAHSAEPTYTASSDLLFFAINQRATYRWVAPPGGEMVIPVTNNAGIGLRSISSGGTANHQGTIMYLE